MTQFVHLNAHSQFSLLEGVPSVKALAAAAKDAGAAALGVTETNNVFSAMEVSKHLAAAGVQPILGVQLGLVVKDVDKLCHITLLAQSRAGWDNALKLVSAANRAKVAHPQGWTYVDSKTLLAHADGLICLVGNGVSSPLVPLIEQGELASVEGILGALKGAFTDRLYVDIQRHGLAHEALSEAALLLLADKLELPIVATNDARFLHADDYEAFEALMCIGDGTVLDDPKRRQLSTEYAFKSSDEMVKLFTDLPDAIENTVHIAKRCAFMLEAVSVKEMFMPEWPSDNGESVADILRAESLKGLERRLADFVFTEAHSRAEKDALRAQYIARLEEEFAVIIPMGFEGYFMITSDFIRWAKRQDIPVGPGRGSGAGSLVAWCLDITDLDPIAWDLYFERFLNPERISLPDFDIDFCQERRDEVITYVQEKYGDPYVSQIITFGSLKARACLRDVGRVLQMSFFEVGRIANFVPEGPTPPPIQDVLDSDDRFKAMYHEDERVQRMVDIALKLEGCYRHAGTHAAGVMISSQKIEDVCGIYVDARTTMPATQLSMYDAEASGLVKFDFLGLKTLSIIKMAVDTVAARCHKTIDILRIPLDDEPTYEMLRAGHTVGVFQIESGGMTDLTKKLKITCMDHLAAVICLYRPGPMELLPDYVARHLGTQDITYDHPVLEPVLKETNGVAIYQEQVMMMARVLAGYTLGGADELRRAMGKKKPEEMAKQREIFVKGCGETIKISAEEANVIFDKMAAFAGYGFNKAHTLAYTLVAYQTAWLKAHHPASFMAASMTYDRGNTPKLLRYKQELLRMKMPLLLPDINASQVMFAVEDSDVDGIKTEGVRYALAAIKGSSEEAMAALVKEREENGTYRDMYDFVGRQSPQYMNKRQLEALINAGAFDTLHNNRAELLANVDLLLGHGHAAHAERNGNQFGLFGGGEGQESELPKPELKVTQQWDMFAKLEMEQKVIGFYLSAHPMEAYADVTAEVSGLKPIAVLEELALKGTMGAKVAGVVLDIRTMKTKKGDRMGFATISDTSGQVELALFPELFASVEALLAQKTPLLINVAMGVDGERVRVNADAVRNLEAAAVQAKLDIHVSNMAAITPLREVLAAYAGGQTKCALYLPVVGDENAKQAVVKLAEPLAFTRQVQAKLEAIDGVACRV